MADVGDHLQRAMFAGILHDEGSQRWVWPSQLFIVGPRVPRAHQLLDATAQRQSRLLQSPREIAADDTDEAFTLDVAEGRPFTPCYVGTEDRFRPCGLELRPAFLV